MLRRPRRPLLLAALVCVGALAAGGCIPIPAGYSKLVWSDEFNGPAGAPVNAANWLHEVGRWGKTLQTYTASTSNSSLDGAGHLLITARRSGTGFTSARLDSKRSFTYGRIEARIQVPAGQGYWPAFWMLGSNVYQVGWPACGEVDVMEGINSCPDCWHVVHGPAAGGRWSKSYKWPSVSPGFHVYALDWTSTKLTLSLDGHVGLVVSKSQLTSSQGWPFAKPFYLLFTFAVGGDWAGPPNNNTKFPATMVVDYVRVFQ